MKYRDHYRLVCRNVHTKKLENLKQIFDENSNKASNNKEIEVKFHLLQQQLKLNEFRHTCPDFNERKPPETLYSENSSSTIPKLPAISTKTSDVNVEAIEKDFNELYSRYSEPDQEFLDKYPAKVELTVTELGKKFLNDQKQQSHSLRKQKQKYTRIQSGALVDERFKDLVSYLN